MTGQLSFAGEAFRLEPTARYKHRHRLQPYPGKANPPDGGLLLTSTSTTASVELIPPHGGINSQPVPSQDEAAPRKTSARAAHEAVQTAESMLLVEHGRPACREHWIRMATAYEQRANAWRLLAASWERDTSGHVVRAMSLAADADMARARMLRHRLAVTG